MLAFGIRSFSPPLIRLCSEGIHSLPLVTTKGEIPERKFRESVGTLAQIQLDPFGCIMPHLVPPGPGTPDFRAWFQGQGGMHLPPHWVHFFLLPAQKVRHFSASMNHFLNPGLWLILAISSVGPKGIARAGQERAQLSQAIQNSCAGSRVKSLILTIEGREI